MNSSSGHGLEKGRYSTPLVTKFKVLIQRRYLATGVVTLLAIAIMTATVAVQVTNRVTGAGADDQATSNSSISSKVKHALNEIECNINPSVDPCDDFYEYACGSFRKRYPRPEDKAETSYHTIYYDQAYRTIVERLQGHELLSKETPQPLKYLKRIWDSCVNDNSETNSVLKKIDYIKELDSLDSWQAKFEKLTKDGYDIFFRVRIRDGNRVLIGPQKFGYEKGSSDAESDYYRELMMLIYDESMQYEIDPVAVISLNHEFAFMTVRRARKSLKSKMSLEELNKYTRIKWDQLLNKLVGRQNFTKSSKVLIEDEEYFKSFKAMDLYMEHDFMNIYFRVSFLHQSCFFLGRECRSLQYEFNQKNQRIQMPKFKSRSEFVESGCFDFLKRNFEDLMFRLLDSNNEMSEKFYSSVIVGLVKELTGIIDSFSWMDEKTKARARELVESGTSVIKGPSIDSDNLDRKYSRAPFIESVEEVELIDYFKGIISWSRGQGSVVKGDNEGTAQRISLFTTLPFFDHESKQLFVPNFFHQGPFASNDLPKPIKFGFFAPLLAHEMVHAFDAVADHYSGFEGQKRLWSKLTRDNFKDKTKCLVRAYFREKIMVEYYGNERVAGINGTFSLNENLADLIGLVSAHDAFTHSSASNELDTTGFPDLLKDLNGDQLFFLAYANAHCSEQAKQVDVNMIHEPLAKSMVNVPVANSEAFAEAFKCKRGSRMNPVKKCTFR